MSNRDELVKKLLIEKLEPEANEFFERIFRRYPDWQKFGHERLIDGEWIPEVIVPSPTGESERNLIFWWDRISGASMGFSYWHGHLEDFSATSVEDCYNHLWQKVESLLRDEALVHVIPKDDGYLATLFDVRRDKEWLTKLGKIISWSGKNDKVNP